MTFKKQDIAIAVSNEVALSMQLNSMIDPYQRGGRLKIKVIQNGVNTEVFRRLTSLRADERSEAISTIGTESESPDSYREENKSPDSYREEIKRLSESPNLLVSQPLFCLCVNSRVTLFIC